MVRFERFNFFTMSPKGREVAMGECAVPIGSSNDIIQK